MTKRPRRPELPNGDDESPSERPEYEIGWRKPPVHSRWRPGQSGNPRGRPKGSRNVRTLLEETLRQRVKIHDGGRTRSISKLECILTITVNKAAQGEIKHLLAVFQLLRVVGMTEEGPSTGRSEPVTDHDPDIIGDFLRRCLPSADSKDPQGTPRGKKRKG